MIAKTGEMAFLKRVCFRLKFSALYQHGHVFSCHVMGQSFTQISE